MHNFGFLELIPLDPIHAVAAAAA